MGLDERADEQRKLAAFLCAALPRLLGSDRREEAERLRNAFLATGSLPDNARDALLEMSAAIGIPFLVESHRGVPGPLDIPGAQALPLASPGSPVIEFLRCPHGTCARRWRRRPGAAPPSCALLGGALRT